MNATNPAMSFTCVSPCVIRPCGRFVGAEYQLLPSLRGGMPRGHFLDWHGPGDEIALHFLYSERPELVFRFDSLADHAHTAIPPEGGHDGKETVSWRGGPVSATTPLLTRGRDSVPVAC